MNIDGLSEATVEKFLAKGLIHEPQIFSALKHKAEIVEMEGFGKSHIRIWWIPSTGQGTPMPSDCSTVWDSNIGLSMPKPSASISATIGRQYSRQLMMNLFKYTVSAMLWRRRMWIFREREEPSDGGRYLDRNQT